MKGRETGEGDRRQFLLRAAADEELNADEQRSLQGHLDRHPEDANVIEFERRLRNAVRRVGQVPAPSWNLRDRVVEAANRRPTAAPWAWGLAAAVLVIAGAALLIRSWPGPVPAPAMSPYQVQLSTFLAEHHDLCLIDAETAAREFTVTDLERVPSIFGPFLGSPVRLGDLAQAGLKFWGAGACAVPGGGRSVHLFFELSGESPRGVSLFVQRDPDKLKLEDGQVYRLLPREGAETRVPTALVWRSEGLIYFLVSRDESSLETARRAIRVPEPRGSV